MFRSLDDFYRAFASLTEGTGKIFAALTDASLGQAVADEHRTLGGMAWHIVGTYTEMMPRTGLNVAATDHNSMPPASADEIRAGYAAVTAELSAGIKSSWSDADLESVDEMYGQKWQRGVTLAILLHHEIHHRGQMTVLMRQAGLKVPGIHGPAEEEWAAYGMEGPPY